MDFSSQLSTQLFWDEDIAKLDWDKHKLLIVERVIERGSYATFKYIEQYYGKNEMARIIKTVAWLHARDIAFVHAYFNIPLNELKCYREGILKVC